MKVILSRKGFDSSNGGIPSPILPDDTLLSLPIPYDSVRKYSELSYGNMTYAEIMEQLGAKCGNGTCHLDPDIRQGVFSAPAEWKPIFGQHKKAQAHLRNMKVRAEDLFLFFGLFRQTEYDTYGKLRFVSKAPNLHVIYGYMQMGDMVTDETEISKYNWHPHANMNGNNNCMYIARDTLTWDSDIKGYGVFSYDKRLQLTKDGMSKSCWNLPDLPAFKSKPSISGAFKDAWRIDTQYGEYYRAMNIGQEFVIEEIPAVEDWAKSLISG